MRKIVVLLGSPNEQGTNSQVVSEVLRGAAECEEFAVEKLWLNQGRLTPCQACDSCMQTGRCYLEDDMEAVYAALVAADAVIFAAPIYFSGISAQAKIVVDRCQALWAAKYMLKQDVFAGRKRPGIFIATGGQPPYEGQFVGAEYVAKLFFKMISVHLVGSLTLPNLDANPISGRPAELQQAYELGKLLAAAQ